MGVWFGSGSIESYSKKQQDKFAELIKLLSNRTGNGTSILDLLDNHFHKPPSTLLHRIFTPFEKYNLVANEHGHTPSSGFILEKKRGPDNETVMVVGREDSLVEIHNHHFDNFSADYKKKNITVMFNGRGNVFVLPTKTDSLTRMNE